MNDPRLSGMSGSSFLAQPKTTGTKKPDEATAAFTALIGRLRQYGDASPPQQYRCIRCFDASMFSVPHPKAIRMQTDAFGELCIRWMPPCQELSVACSCPNGSAKYASVNDWLREKKKPTRLWSIRDYETFLLSEFHEVFGNSDEHARAWIEEQTPAAKAAILAAKAGGAC
jgi:hypothetical protein